MRTIGREARRDPQAHRVSRTPANPRLLRAVQQIVDEGIAKPVLLGRRDEIEALCDEMSLDMLSHGVEVIDPRTEHERRRTSSACTSCASARASRSCAAQALIQKSDYYAALMVDRGDADGMVTGLRLNYPETVRPLLEIFGLSAGREGRGRHVHDGAAEQREVLRATRCSTSIPTPRRSPTSRVQMADAVQGFGVTPRIAMISYSNFGSVRHPTSRARSSDAIEIVRARRPDLEIDGEMQPEIALDPERRKQHYRFSRLHARGEHAGVPVPRSGNAAYQVAEGRSAARRRSARSCSACRSRARRCRTTPPPRTS